ncbi:MAG: 2-phosphosulfolactate phosphatase [Actinobacteria bacterium]|nr:2-phosphosulfolactate phosphatase [Actinomycetota bacterium]
MRVQVFPTAGSVDPGQMKGKTAIVIDVLRATSTIVTALANGCVDVVPVLSPEEAFNLVAEWPEGSYLLGGERRSVKIPGFHLGNSPLEYTSEAAGGRRVVLTTTNGTRAIKAGEGAEAVYIASFLNAFTVSRYALVAARDVAIICSGTRENFDLCDVTCAGAIVKNLTGPELQADLDDLALAARDLFGLYEGRLAELLYLTAHGQDLVNLGLKDDLVHCAQLDSIPLVPEFKDGRIFLADPV